jgi:hypothetical protein
VECGSPSRCTTTRANKGSERSQASDNKSESAVGEKVGRLEGGTESEGKRCLRCIAGLNPNGRWLSRKLRHRLFIGDHNVEPSCKGLFNYFY